MTPDEMIALAKEAGWEYATDDRGFEPLWRFAALVAAAEREACARVCEEEAADFEQMANGCSDGRYDWKADGCMDCAAAIRARGEK
jgi:hypothetical protein